MGINPEIKSELKSRLDLILKYKGHRRNQEDIIEDLIRLLKKVKKETFLPFVIQMMNSIQMRHSSEIFENLMSPLKQLAYIVDLRCSIDDLSQTEEQLDKKDWNRMTELLMEVEMTYFGEIGFFDEGKEGFDVEKIGVSLKSFFDYYSNGQLCYDEQTLYRLENNFTRFDEDIFAEFGFNTNHIVGFCLHLKTLMYSKVDQSFYYFKNQEKWPDLTSEFIDKGIIDPKDWVDQPELKELKDFLLRPGSWFVHKKQDLFNSGFDIEISKKLFEFLKFDFAKISGKTIYYSDSRQYFETPLIEINEEEVLCPHFKFLIESFYDRINQRLAEIKKEKYTQYKNKMLEKKTFEVFKKFFGSGVALIPSFYFDPKTKAEQDLMIFHQGNLFVIEIKDFKFRAPLRNPINAFERIKSDFKGGIQKAYDQCKRLEDKIALGKTFKCFDLKTNKEVFEVRANKVKNYFSIIVTQHKYGAIQTNLKELLIKQDEDLYPLSICVDDLEVFLLTLKKIKKESAVKNLIRYLTYRESFHERLLCSDEMEMCGLFLLSESNFEKFAKMDEVFATDSRMSEIFDAYYANGLGFENELDIERKKNNKIGDYAKSFDANLVSGNDIMEP